jgi:hypothetical protein
MPGVARCSYLKHLFPVLLDFACFTFSTTHDYALQAKRYPHLHVLLPAYLQGWSVIQPTAYPQAVINLAVDTPHTDAVVAYDEHPTTACWAEWKKRVKEVVWHGFRLNLPGN